MTALLAPRGQEPRRSPWRALQAVVRPHQTLSRAPFILVVAAFMAVGMLVLLLLNTALQEQAFAVRAQQRQATELGYRVADLEAQATEARSAAGLARRASDLGLRPNIYPVFLTLPEGSIIGDPTAVTGWELPEVKYRTPEQLQAEAEARDRAAAERARLAAEKKKADEAAKAAEAEAAANAAASPSPSAKVTP